MRAIDDDDHDEGVVPPGEEVVPGYVVVELLSRGGRIDTYDVHSTQRRCRCVVKIVRPDRVDEPHVCDAVRTEGQVLVALSHPHLVRAYELVEDPRPAVVLETLGGLTLDAVVQRRGLGVDDAVHLARQLASALAYLNDAGWLHLDVKPENVVVDRGRAILIDLSIAGRPGPGRPGAGTEEYLAPEQRTGEMLGAAADVWGWAMTVTEALLGRLPDPVRRRRPPSRVRPTRAHPLGQTVPPRLLDLLEASLDPDPAQRPDWTAVLDALGAGRGEPRRGRLRPG